MVQGKIYSVIKNSVFGTSLFFCLGATLASEGFLNSASIQTKFSGEESLEAYLEQIAIHKAAVSDLISIYGERVSAWPRSAIQKNEIINREEEILCLELKSFSLVNKLNLEVDCTTRPKKLPSMQLSLLKTIDNELAIGSVEEGVRQKLGYLNAAITKFEKLKNLYPGLSYEEKIRDYKTEVTCLEQYPNVISCPDSFDGMKILTLKEYKSRPAHHPRLTLYVIQNGKRLAFKSWTEITIRTGFGPKLRQGDFMTPEGVFSVNSPTTETKYFVASTIDYENWKNRNEMLSNVPDTMKKVPNRGGSILIHGAGGSDGCLSFNNNSEAAYINALTRNKRGAQEALQISIFPAPMSEEFIESASSDDDLMYFRDFWQKLLRVYREEIASLNSNVKTMNEIYEEN